MHHRDSNRTEPNPKTVLCLISNGSWVCTTPDANVMAMSRQLFTAHDRGHRMAWHSRFLWRATDDADFIIPTSPVPDKSSLPNDMICSRGWPFTYHLGAGNDGKARVDVVPVKVVFHLSKIEAIVQTNQWRSVNAFRRQTAMIVVRLVIIVCSRLISFSRLKSRAFREKMLLALSCSLFFSTSSKYQSHSATCGKTDVTKDQWSENGKVTTSSMKETC